MKKRNLYMFLILQLLVIVMNYQNINTTLFNIALLDFLKIIVFLYNILYIAFISKSNSNKKCICYIFFIIIFLLFLFDKSTVNKLIENLYYCSSFSFIFFYFQNNKINKFNILFLSLGLLTLLDFILLFNNEMNNIYLQLLTIMLLSISLLLNNLYKKVTFPIYIFTIYIAMINNMFIVLYNSIILLFFILITNNKKDLKYNSLLLIISIIFISLKNLLSLNSLFHTFELFDFNINIMSIIVSFPLLIIICRLITNLILKKDKSLEGLILIYNSLLIVSLTLISLNNTFNELIMLYYSIIIVLFIDKVNQNNKILKKEISFFVLHLGYGGIESSTVNSANELSKYYKVRIVSFYNLKRNIEKTIDNSITIKHLYNGEPNKEELIDSIKNKKIIKIISNGFRAIKILFLKEYLNLKEMYYCNSKYVVSTRNEYTLLLNEYGNMNTIKIAQEHMHHRDNKKYINNIKYRFNNIDYLFSLTESLKSDYIKFLEKNNKTKVVVIPNIIYLPKKKSNLKNKNFITISRLNSIKKIEDMIEIFNKVKDKQTKLFIIGDGEELPKLKEIVKEMKLEERVIFTGYKTKKEMEEYILKSRLFLLTSLSEGLPMVLLEAMSYGIPCIAFRTKSGVSDIIDDNRNGFIIDNRNKEKYIEKIDELMNNKELINEFSKNSIEKAKQFTSKEIIKKWKEVLEYEK